jgi:hypothetical protein
MVQDTTATDLKADLVITALLAEYKNIHQRVMNQIESYETANVRLLTLVGVLLYFGITNFNHTDLYVFTLVNMVFIVAIPFLALGSVAFTAANLVKIMIWGDFLKRVENKVNKVLRREGQFYGFERNHIMDWEYWRVVYGYAGSSNLFSAVTFDGFLVLATVISTVTSVLLRLNFIRNDVPESYLLYRAVSLFMLAIFLVGCCVCLVLFRRQRVKSSKDVYDDETV